MAAKLSYIGPVLRAVASRIKSTNALKPLIFNTIMSGNLQLPGTVIETFGPATDIWTIANKFSMTEPFGSIDTRNGLT
jgi:hypothetical protein